MELNGPGNRAIEMSADPQRSSVTEPLQPDQDQRKCGNLVAYWILGLCNNFGYVVMLSAAHDILSQNFNQNSEEESSSHSEDNSTRECNPTSTGAILLADILPSLAIKILAPFFPFLVHVRMLMVVVLAAVGFLLVALSTREWIAVLGVACTSLGSGLGEVTLLSYSSVFDKNVISTWSSGTGAAGILGASSYAGLTSLGLSAADSLLLMLIVPVVMAATFWFLLRTPGSRLHAWRSVIHCSNIDEEKTQQRPSSASVTESETSAVESAQLLTVIEKFKSIPPLLVYMIPLGLVYLFEYFINQGLFELIYFPNIWLTLHEQYRWLQVDYQIGVFLSRSSVNLFVVRKLWVLALLQFLNVIFFTFEAVYLFVPSVWIVFAVVLWEGLLGGAAYVNTFYRISVEVPFEKREFSMGITSLSDSIGIGLAGAIALPVHNILCQLPKPY
ncbi:Battenin [Cryptotermes secundus]|uniref:Battenin n=1 Tax=Cryptotermes secundus TaxID=105785 RepID=A0A2J7QD59_9NEOP|nr:battenin isoform X2 [Cryptotermes secundus]PNF26521.1 Battenin [Cryptotermes secundus]